MLGRVTFDRDLNSGDIQALSGVDAVTSFFANLGYDTGGRVPLTAAAIGITADSLARKVRRIERLASADGDALQVYLIELDSVTVAFLNGLARALRNRAGDYLLVVTTDYERLDFVLIEREDAPTAATSLSTPHVLVRPRTLSVKRRDPGKVALRALRRLTYTEADSYAQFDKLRSAYTVAEWAEPLFNNRALVSDYFLIERLPTWPEWAEDPRPAYRQLRDLYARARERLGGRDEAALGSELVGPALDTLGFSAYPADGDSSPDLWLGVQADRRVACLVYPWDRYLDGRDEVRDARRAADTPGARVVGVLEVNPSGWAIVTNGKLWRLYCGAAHSTASNYYEIDLEETLAATDPNEAFRYFWLMFRATAFSSEPGGQPFVERLVAESNSFSASLGDQLKGRVFEQIFPLLASGFIDHHRAAEPGVELDQDALDETFRATLTLLYRLLFILFAEARDLLPVREQHGYAGLGLDRLRREIAEKAGPLADQRQTRLQSAYKADAASTSLFEATLALSRAIDHGDPSMNLPLYDGGLFLTDPDPKEETPEASAARYLAARRVPNAHMAMALDLLARDIDPKRGDLVFIDYKSLGVRHLGSIYEGLLEFRLRIASERMAIVKGKRTEEVVPYAQAVAEKRTILRQGRGKGAAERTLEVGNVYLQNDKRERQATGSYYTPDHIVQYIVANAVGPALEAHLETLRPRMREAQQAYRQAVQRAQAFQKQGMRGDDPEKTANDPRWIALADEVFEFRVVDPAMGSGHFLVEAVDLITDKLLVFLNAFPWNPIQAALRRTRETIQSELERQNVTIDSTKLNDLNLLKRQVLKRCVYGVDLNPMAVELAKVSLWLDCFTLGAPLSFLDHHLKCGNSLVGVSIVSVEEALQVQHGQHYGTLFGGTEFTGVKQAVEAMRLVGGLSDVTPSQVVESRGQFRRASDGMAPFKAMLNVYTSRWFGNRPTKSKSGFYDQTVEFLATGESLAWLKGGASVQGVPLSHRNVLKVAQAAAREHRFFHWQLEFPEVFFGASPASQQVVELKTDGGFDAVIGNPPYDVLASEELGYDVSELVHFAGGVADYAPAVGGKINLYKLFICRGFWRALVKCCGNSLPARLIRPRPSSADRSVVAPF